MSEDPLGVLEVKLDNIAASLERTERERSKFESRLENRLSGVEGEVRTLSNQALVGAGWKGDMEKRMDRLEKEQGDRIRQYDTALPGVVKAHVSDLSGTIVKQVVDRSIQDALTANVPTLVEEALQKEAGKAGLDLWKKVLIAVGALAWTAIVGAFGAWLKGGH